MTLTADHRKDNQLQKQQCFVSRPEEVT